VLIPGNDCISIDAVADLAKARGLITKLREVLSKK